MTKWQVIVVGRMENKKRTINDVHVYASNRRKKGKKERKKTLTSRSVIGVEDGFVVVVVVVLEYTYRCAQS